MKSKIILKTAVDFVMTIALLLLMTYELIGQATHEWVGIGIFVLFILHHVLNGKWSPSLFKGRYTAPRIMQTVLVAEVLLSMLGSMVSGVILSRHALSFLSISTGRSFARSLYMLSAYWGFAFMGLYLGFHWSTMMGLAGKLMKTPSETRKWILRGTALLIAGYGVYAFIKRDMGSYMLLKNQFVFFDFEEPLILFLLDYTAIMGLFVFIGHSSSLALKGFQKRKMK
ncbi:MAG: DUF4405 domain-containing protein [Acutalibacteraceae bacterium]